MNKTLIVIDDNKAVLSAVTLLARPYFSKIVTFTSPQQGIDTIRIESPSCILLDMNFKAVINNGNEGLYWLKEIRRINPTVPVVLFTAYADIDLAVRGIKEGATDFIVKPWENKRMIEILLKASDSTMRGTANKNMPNSMFWGATKTMDRLRQLSEKIAVTDANILITGENGTGKEMLAREIHKMSKRQGRMISVDMGSINDNLFESELFGAAKGAYTGAVADRKGRIAEADKGTLFLDEIGNLSMVLQSKLLGVLQNRKVIPVGSVKEIEIDTRLVCATNCDIDDMVANGNFREDLLYRINTVRMHLPPLRERREDIVPLANMFLQRYATRYNRECNELSASSISLLMTHSWPGNIRELEHAVEKAVIVSDGNVVHANDFTISTRHVSSTKPASLHEMEEKMIREALELCDGNVSAVASRLGITRQTLYNKMKKYGL